MMNSCERQSQCFCNVQKLDCWCVVQVQELTNSLERAQDAAAAREEELQAQLTESQRQVGPLHTGSGAAELFQSNGD